MLRLRIFTAVAAITFAHGATAEELKPRDAALRLMGAFMHVPGGAAYCRSKGWLQDGDLEPVAAWNKKHDATMRKVISVIEATGGMSAKDRETLDKVAFRLVKQEIEDGEPKENCRALINAVRSDGFDLRAVPELKDAIAVLDKN